jgi:predicted ATPase/DNA-binding SARP family transcriptional activator
MSGLQFSMLGALAVENPEGEITIAGNRRRALLLRLLVAANHPVASGRLGEDLWDGRPPAGAATTLHSYISRLRGLLGADRIATEAGGYTLRVHDGELDSWAFEAEAITGRAALQEGDPARAEAVLARALNRWRGDALEDVAGAAWAEGERARLEELHLGALESRVEALLALGNHTGAVAVAEGAVRIHPLRERLWALLMTALYRGGRQAEALAAYQRLRHHLREELGLEPSPELVTLEQAILQHKPQDSGKLRLAAAKSPTAATHPRDNAAADVLTRDHELPTGVVTFLLTDLVESTRLWDIDPAAMEVATAALDELVATVVGDHGGALLKSRGEGDSTLSVFQRATDAVNCALELRAAMATREWPSEPLRARMALHTGEAIERDADFYGPTVNRAARIRAHAAAQQILVSSVAAGIIADRLRHQIELVDLGSVRLRGISGEEHLFEVSPMPAHAVARSDPRLAHRQPAAFACRQSPLVGRDSELAALVEAWESACSGVVRLAVVRGPCGAGKTRLAAELAAVVSRADGLVLYAACRRDGAFAFEALTEALARTRSDVEPDLAKPFGRGALFTALAPVADAAAGLGRWLKGDRTQERSRLLDAFDAVIRAAAGDRPVALIVDDTQWLDVETRELIVALTSADIPLPLLVVTTVEPTDPDALDDLVHAAGTVLELSPLSDSVEVGKARAIGAAASQVLEVAEVAGGEVSNALLAAVVGGEEHAEDIAAACDELVATGLLRQGDEHVTLAHHAASTVARTSLTPQRLALLHGRIGRALRDSDDGVVDLRRVAHHLLLADDERRPAVDAARRAAADAAERHLWLDAATCADSALRAAREAGLEDELEMDLLGILARAEAQLGTGDTSWLSATQEASHRTKRVAELAFVAVSRAEHVVCGERDSELIDLCRDALRISDASIDAATHVRLRVALAFALSAAGDRDAPAEAFAALELARSTGDSTLLRSALAAGRAAMAGSWDMVTRRRMADELEALTSDHEHHADALLSRSDVRLFSGDTLGAVADSEAAAAEVSVRVQRSPSMVLAAGAAGLRVGNFAAAEAALDSVCVDGDRSDLAVAAALMRFWLAHERGTMPVIEQRSLDGALPRPIADALHAIACADGNDEAATSASLDRLVAVSETNVQSGAAGVLVEVARALAITATSKAIEAAALYERMAPGSGRVVVTLGSLGLGPCDYYLGLLAESLGRSRAAIRHHRQALDLCERTGMNPAAVRCRVALASVLLERHAPGDVAEARRLTAEACADAEQTGMTSLLEAASAQLAAAGSSSIDTGAWRVIHESEQDSLPLELTSLVGRDDLIADVVSRVATDRLLTLWGPGGVGKTRLAVRVAREVRPSFADGVRLVDLTPVGNSVAEAVLAAVEGQRHGEETSNDAVIRVLAPARMLVVVDNCEHVLDQTREVVAEVLRNCPDVHLLATSREALVMAGEHIVAVPPLEVPHQQTADVASVLSSAAGQLFVERAVASTGSFAPDLSNADEIAEVCRYAGGLPLAVELAAGRLHVESLGELVERLRHTRSLQGLEVHGPASDRRASLTASVAWSYDLLDRPAQALLRAVAVYAGPFSRNMALALSPADEDVADRAFDRLVGSALVNRFAGRDGRFRMLEPARQFARQRSSPDELRHFRSRHADVMLARAERFGPEIRTADEASATEVLRADLADHRAAITWLIDETDERGAQMLVALFQFFHFEMVPEASHWAAVIARQLRVDHPLGPPVWGAAALGAWLEGRMTDAIDLGEQSLLLATKSGAEAHPWGLLALINAYAYTNNFDRATEVYQLLATGARQSPDPFWKINGLGYESVALLMVGRSDRSRERAEKALALARELSNAECLQWSLYNLGRTWATRDDRLAATAFDEAIAVTRAVGSRWGRCLNLIEWVGAERRLGEFDAAAAGLLELLQLLTANGHRSLLSQALREVAYVVHAAGDDDTAAVALLAREGLPDMPVLSGDRDEPLLAVLRAAAGDRWDRLWLRAHSMPEADVVRRCRERLDRPATSWRGE